jgi:hypothetical protein
MRVFPVLAFLMLAACDQVIEIIGPSDRDIKDALHRFYNPPPESEPRPMLPEIAAFRTAKVAKVAGCKPHGSYYMCEVQFEMPNGARVPTALTVAHRSNPSEWLLTGGPVIQR